MNPETILGKIPSQNTSLPFSPVSIDTQVSTSFLGNPYFRFRTDSSIEKLQILFYKYTITPYSFLLRKEVGPKTKLKT